MANTISPDQLGAAIARELSTYSAGVTERVNDCGRRAAKDLVKLTKATAPARSGGFKKNIAMREDSDGRGMKKYTWHVKAPDHRLTHLLVHGHATKDGGRTKADPFLANALAQVLPAYEKEVEEAVSGD